MKGASNIAPMGIRIPDELKLKIQDRAREHGRSMNAEIVQIIEDSVNGGATFTPEAIKKLTDTISELKRIISLKDEISGYQERTIKAYAGQISLLEEILKRRFGFDVDQELQASRDKNSSTETDSEDNSLEPTLVNKKPT